MAQRHTRHRNVYHNCQRCGTTQPLAQLVWQNGILVCTQNRCVDIAIVGSRDLAVAKAVSIYRHEFEPDSKLTNPTDRRSDQTDVLY